MNTMASPEQAADQRVDARPVRHTSNETTWDRANALRDHIAAIMRETLEKEGLDAAVFLSSNGEFPPWVKLEAWLPWVEGPACRERAELQFTIDCKPYYEHSIVVSARLVRGKVSISVGERPDFPDHCFGEWIRFAIGRGKKPSNYRPTVDALLGLLASVIPFARGPHSNRLSTDHRTRFTGATALFWAGAVLAGLAFMESSGAGVALGVVLAVAAGVIAHRRKRSVSVTPQSERPPRNLGLVDSWHAVVADLGRDFDNVRMRLLKGVTADAENAITQQLETYTHRAPNGYEQRERLVLSKDQGMVHVHVYKFGNDVFIGWHAYLNWAQWGETSAVSMKIRPGHEVEYRDLRPSFYVPNQFDLIDLSSLSEFVHRRIERELKLLLKELAIDQEIDFKVIRGDRDRALDQERHKTDSKKRKPWSYRTSA